MAFGILVLGLTTLATAGEVEPRRLGVLGAGTGAETEVLAAHDPRMFFPIQGCVAPRDLGAYTQALADATARRRLADELRALVDGPDSDFRRLLAGVTAGAASARLTVGISSVGLDTLSGPRTVYFPTIDWTDGQARGSVSFSPCDGRSFRVERKQTRVIREQTVETLAEIREPLAKEGGGRDTVTFRIRRARLSVTTPDEKPGAVQRLGDGNTRLCYVATDDSGAAVTSFAAYRGGSESYQVDLPEVTKTLAGSESLRRAVCPFPTVPAMKSGVVVRRYSLPLLEQRELQMQVRLCEPSDEPFRTDRLEWMYLGAAR